MKLIVFGASGGVGGEVVGQALAAGHDVTAVVRDPARLAAPLRAARVITVPVIDGSGVLLDALQGQDVVVSALGPRGRANAGIIAPLTRSITEAMRLTGVRRLIVISAAPVGPAPEGNPFLLRAIVTPIVKRIFRNVYADLAIMERELAQTDLDWTVVRPPRLRTVPQRGGYRTALDAGLRGGASIGRADLAEAILDLSQDPHTMRHAVGVAY
jgi:putative NADH-flavin reductase